MVNARSFIHITMVLFDTANEQQARGAYKTSKLLVQEAAKQGYGEYRAHLDFMDLAADQYSFGDHAYRSSRRRSRMPSIPTASSPRASRASGRARCGRRARAEGGPVKLGQARLIQWASCLRPHGLAVRTPAFHAGDRRFESGWGYSTKRLEDRNIFSFPEAAEVGLFRPGNVVGQRSPRNRLSTCRQDVMAPPSLNARLRPTAPEGRLLAHRRLAPCGRRVAFGRRSSGAARAARDMKACFYVKGLSLFAWFS